jgi:hypothetical protein
MPEIGGVTIEVSAEVADALGGVKAVREELNEVDGDALAAAAALQQGERSLDELGEEGVEVASQLKVLEAAANDAQDSTEELGDAANSTAASMSVLGASTNAAVIDLGIFNVTITAGTLAALSLLLAALSAVTVAFIGLGAAVLSVFGAFGLLLGAGLIGNLERIQRTLQLNARAIEDAFEPLAEIFGPLIEDAILQLDELIDKIVESVGGTEQFQGALRSFGSVLMDVIPALTGLMFDIARNALPALRRVIRFFLQNGDQIFQGIVETTQKLLPRIVELSFAVAALLPELIDTGIAVADLVLPALTIAIGVLTVVLKLFNVLPDSVQTFTVGLAALVTLTNVSLIPALFRAAGALVAVGQAALTALGPVGALLAALGLLAGLSIGTIMLTRDNQGRVTQVQRNSGTRTGPSPQQVAASNVNNGIGTQLNLSVGQINASSREGGSAAARGLNEELSNINMSGNTSDTSRGP